MNIPVILGTARVGRYSEKVANFVLGQVKKANLSTELIDVRDYRIAATDNLCDIPQAKNLADKIKKADALIMVMPEYNHGFPGELKMMLDMLYEEYEGKPVAFCGVSAGPLGGARGVQLLKLVCSGVGMYPIKEGVYFGNVQQLFDQAGNITDTSYERKMEGLISALTAKVSS